MTSLRDDHDELREALGAYALGQLDDDLRRRVDLHLSTCITCAADLAEIRPVAVALRAVDVAAPPGLDERIRRALPPPDRAPRRRVPWTAAVLTAGAVAAAVVITAIVVHDDAPQPVVVAVPRVVTAAGVTAKAGLVDHRWGVEVKLRVTGLQAGARYRMWVVADDGSSRDAGEFVGVAATEVVCDRSSSVLLEHATAFRVVDDRGAEVVSADIGS